MSEWRDAGVGGACVNRAANEEPSGTACLCHLHMETETQAEGGLRGPTAGPWECLATTKDPCHWSAVTMGEVAGDTVTAVVRTDNRGPRWTGREFPFSSGMGSSGLGQRSPVRLFAF